MSYLPATAVVVLVQLPFLLGWGGGNGARCGWRWRGAPCWVLKEQPCRSRVGGGVPSVADACGWLLFSVPGTAWEAYRSRADLDGLLVVLVSSVGLWVGRWLRITQWTRASCFLWLSCQGRTVDALAPGADEGRGRPR